MKKTSDDVNNVGTEVGQDQGANEIRKRTLKTKVRKDGSNGHGRQEENAQAKISPLNEKIAKFVKKAVGVSPESYKEDVKAIIAEGKQEANDTEKKTTVSKCKSHFKEPKSL